MLPVVNITEEPIACFQAELCRVMRQYLGFQSEAGKESLPWQIVLTLVPGKQAPLLLPQASPVHLC